LPRLTLRRVRSVGRWTHHHNGSSSGGGGSNGSSGGGRGGSSGAGRSVEPWLDDAELTAAAQCIMSAGG
jgi:hypothetical protein